MAATERTTVGPPIPAPYLAGLPAMPDELGKALAAGNRGRRPTPEQLAEARRVIDRLRGLIRQARERYEREHGITIQPEPPAA